MHLHRRSTQLECALQGAERLLCQRAQQICELEEVPKIPLSPNDQLELEHHGLACGIIDPNLLSAYGKKHLLKIARPIVHDVPLIEEEEYVAKTS